MAGDRLVVGRDDSCDLVLEGLELEHIALEWTAAGYRVVPLGGAIHLDAEPLSGSAHLASGQRLGAGPLGWRYRADLDPICGLPRQRALLGLVERWRRAGRPVELVRLSLGLPAEERAPVLREVADLLAAAIPRGSVISAVAPMNSSSRSS